MDGSVVFEVDFVSNHPVYHHLVIHFGAYSNGNGVTFNDRDDVRMEIKRSDREEFARYHSAGHLIDIGMSAVGTFEAVKGYHFPKGAYVEYSGNIPVEERESAKEVLQ